MNLAQDKSWTRKAPPLQGRGLGWGMSQQQIDWLHQRAREMRRNPTEPEKRLWRNLSNSKLDALKFRRQEVIGPFIADFMCPARALIVEVDGDTHDGVKDRLRDDELAQFGFLVVRVSNHDVMSNIEGVLEVIRLAAVGRVSRHMPHPNPSPEGEGLGEVGPREPLAISLEGSVG